MTQAEFARRTGINRSMLNKYEHGIQKPAMDNLIAMARTLDCSLDWLCGLED
ncbi:helix-turn-helix protein [compost metagenome]